MTAVWKQNDSHTPNTSKSMRSDPKKRHNPPDSQSRVEPENDKDGSRSTNKKARKINASVHTPLRTFHKIAKVPKSSKLDQALEPQENDPEPEPQEKNDSEPDFSDFQLFRAYLTDEYLRRGFLQPPAVLELASVFIRCLLSVKRDCNFLDTLRGFQTNARKFHLQLIAALGWIYADCYTNALPGNKSRIQTLSALAGEDASKFDCAMELVRVLLVCARKTYRITENEVVDAKIGGWFNNRLSQIRKGVWSVDQRIAEGNDEPAEGLYFPFYLVLRAIHPNCSLVAADSLVRITLAEVWQLVLEPRLYAKELYHISAGVEIKLLPRDIHGVNYNLWFLYDCLEPEPFWCERMDHYFTEYLPPEFKDRKMLQGMEWDLHTQDTSDTQEERKTSLGAKISQLIQETPFPFHPRVGRSPSKKVNNKRSS